MHTIEPEAVSPPQTLRARADITHRHTPHRTHPFILCVCVSVYLSVGMYVWFDFVPAPLALRLDLFSNTTRC